MRNLFFILLLLAYAFGTPKAFSQELNCTVKVIHSQIQGTNTSVFETLETAIADFLNNKAWTDLQFQKDERIECTMNITITKYEEAANHFVGEILFQLARPIYNSSYNSTVFSMKDPSLDFVYKEYDPLEWNENNLDNNLTAILAYYAYLFIGMDLDTFSPLGGTDVLHIVENIVNNAQTLSEPGWSAFKDTKNRHAIINDYMESAMEPFRQLQYKYYRSGLDEMANNVERGRTEISKAIENGLKAAHENKPLSLLPQIWTDYKKDELKSIYQGKGTQKEKERIYDMLMTINASQSNTWDDIKK